MKFSKFKLYFNLHKENLKLSNYVKRFSERFFRDPRFRAKVVIPVVTTVFFLQLIFLPGKNQFQKSIKKFYIDRKFKKSELKFDRKKDKDNFQSLINSFTEKIEFSLKNELYSHDNLKKEINIANQILDEFSYYDIKLLLDITYMIGQLENSILEKYKMLLKDEEFIQTLYKYTISFPKHFIVNLSEEAVRYNTLLIEYIKEVLVIYINTFSLVVIYQNDRINLFYSFYNFLTRPGIDNILKELIDLNFILLIIESLAKDYGNNDCLIYFKIIEYLSDKHSNDFININLYSNILINIYESANKELKDHITNLCKMIDKNDLRNNKEEYERLLLLSKSIKDKDMQILLSNLTE